MGSGSSDTIIPCGPVPADVEQTFTDLVEDLTHSGTMEIDVLIDDFCFEIDKVEVVSGDIDDFGTIGGVFFDNHLPCPEGKTTEVSLATVAYTYVGGKVLVDWDATSSATCGTPSGIKGVLMRVSFKLKS